MKNLLLVGATGFLGQHLRKFYQNQGWKVFTLGRAENSDYIFNPEKLDTLLSLNINVNFDRLINAAAINEVDINNNISTTYDVNVTLTRYLVELAHKHKIREFIYISTFHVYGNSTDVIDVDLICEPKNDYGLTHYLSEQIVGILGKTYGINTLIIRPTNIYGCPVNMSLFNRWSLVPFAFIKDAIEEKSIKIRSSGLQVRNFVSVLDVLKATLLIERMDIVNAYGLDTLTIREFALKIASVINSTKKGDVNVKWLDADKTSNAETLSFAENKDYHPVEKIENYISDFVELLNE
jgi:UDP-glucose 4-epimerase